jgi:hypothetical protein
MDDKGDVGRSYFFLSQKKTLMDPSVVVVAFMPPIAHLHITMDYTNLRNSSMFDLLGATTIPPPIGMHSSEYKHRMLQQDTLKSYLPSGDGCWRKCPPTRRNHIVVNFNRQAGLNDRC